MSKRLAGKQHIGLQPLLLVAEQASRAAHAALNLIDNEEHPARLCPVLQLFQIPLGRRDDAAALIGLDNHSACVLRGGGLIDLGGHLQTRKAAAARALHRA